MNLGYERKPGCSVARDPSRACGDCQRQRQKHGDREQYWRAGAPGGCGTARCLLSQPSVSPAVEATAPGNELELPAADQESSVLDLAVFVNVRHRCGECCWRKLETPCQGSNDVPRTVVYTRAQACSLAREECPPPDVERVQNRPRRQVCTLCEEVDEGTSRPADRQRLAPWHTGHLRDNGRGPAQGETRCPAPSRGTGCLLTNSQPNNHTRVHGLEKKRRTPHDDPLPWRLLGTSRYRENTADQYVENLHFENG